MTPWSQEKGLGEIKHLRYPIKYLSCCDSWQLIRFDIFKSISIDFFQKKKKEKEKDTGLMDKARTQYVRAEGKVGHKLAPQEKQLQWQQLLPRTLAWLRPPFQLSAQCQEDSTICILAPLELSPGRSRNRGLYLGTGRKS